MSKHKETDSTDYRSNPPSNLRCYIYVCRGVKLTAHFHLVPRSN